MTIYVHLLVCYLNRHNMPVPGRLFGGVKHGRDLPLKGKGKVIPLQARCGPEGG